MARTDPNSPAAGFDPAADEPDDGVVAPLLPAEIAAQSLGDYLRAQFTRIKTGDSGMLPVVLALVAIVVAFQSVSPHHIFLSHGNLVNLFQQSTWYVVLAMGEIFVLLLGEIDLSIGFLGAVGAVIAVQLVEPVTNNWPWWAAIIVALIASAFMGLIQGLLVTVLRLPSLIVTLATSLVWNGLLLIVLAYGPFSGYPPLNGNTPSIRALHDLINGTITPVAGWISMIVVVGLLGGWMIYGDLTRRRSGLVTPPLSLTLIKIGLIAVAGIAVVYVCNLNRATTGKLEGVPFAIPIVLAILALWTFLLGRTRFGRYIYAIGGNREAARRAGIKVDLIRTSAFMLSGLTAGAAMLFYASYIGGMSNNVNGGQLVLFAVASAVIGGTSLFGGRGKAVHGVLGGVVIGAIYNGMFLLGLPAQWLYIVTGGVLVFAVTVDSLFRGGQGGRSLISALLRRG
ncbi:MAG: ABC transporter permease [Acidobacteriota bacterium]|nr:ABC transporter permease [Acidobacteriota bacterium]